ncbi:MAG: glutathione S-transferase [Nitratireductor sp.]
MKLWYSPASPFVRKVLIVAHETGQTGELQIVEAATNAVSRNMELVRDNPSGKIPALVLDDGTVLFDSRVICAFLDARHSGTKLAPQEGMAKFQDMMLEALGDAIMDAAVLARYEEALRPVQYQWAEWGAGQMAKVTSSLDQLEGALAGMLGSRPTMGLIAVASALGYLDFRFESLGWRASHPKLAAWFAEFSKRPSMAASAP